MFEVLNSLVQTASGKAVELTKEGYELVKQSAILGLEQECNGDEEGDNETGEFVNVEEYMTLGDVSSPEEEKRRPSVKTIVTRQLFSAAPPGWESPMEEWKLLAESALMEKNGCVIPPNKILEDETLASSLCNLLGIVSVKSLSVFPAVGNCEPSAEVVDWMLSSPDMLVFRSSLVPRHVTDEQYWVNVSWRFCLYRMCHNTQQLLELMKVLTTDPISPEATKGGAPDGNKDGASSSAAYWQKLQKELDSKRELAEWLETQIKNVRQEMELASDNLLLLTNIIKKREVTELGDSVLESCKYHKVKLARVIGDLQAHRSKLDGSCLCMESGSLFAQLIDLNELVRMRIEAYAALTSGHTSETWETVSRADREEEPSKVSVGGIKETDGAIFEAELPWEDESGDKKKEG